MTRSVEASLRNELNVRAKVRMMLPGTLERFEGKSSHVEDLRKYD